VTITGLQDNTTFEMVRREMTGGTRAGGALREDDNERAWQGWGTITLATPGRVTSATEHSC
jgi:hypothetical protein